MDVLEVWNFQSFKIRLGKVCWACWPFPIQQFLLFQCRMTMDSQGQSNWNLLFTSDWTGCNFAPFPNPAEQSVQLSTCSLFCCCCGSCCYCLFPFVPFYSLFLFPLSWLWWGLPFVYNKPFWSPWKGSPCHSSRSSLYDMFLYQADKGAIWSGGMVCDCKKFSLPVVTIVPKAAPWPHSIQRKTPLEWPLFIEEHQSPVSLQEHAQFRGMSLILPIDRHLTLS